MKRIFSFLVILLLARSFTSAAEIVNADSRSKIALQAYDPVAFFTDGKPAKGNPSISTTHKEHTYLFATEEHKKEFQRNPDKYLPAYGGYCAYGVSLGYFFPVEIDTWEIVDGRLVLQFSKDIKKIFAADQMGNSKKAEANWPKLVEKENAGK